MPDSTQYQRIGDDDSLPLVVPHQAAFRITRKPVPDSETQSEFELELSSVFKEQTKSKLYQAITASGATQDETILPPRPKLSQNQSPRQVAKLWKWEIAALFVSIVALMAIIILLRVYGGRDLSAWDAPFSINSVISILSAVFKGAMWFPVSNGLSRLKWLSFTKGKRSLSDMDVYDRASRSSWGSILFIVQNFGRDKTSLLASLGALVAVLTLIVDPFSQASVSVGSCSRVLVGKPAVVSRTNNYTAWGGHTGAALAELDVGMQSAILSGLYQPPANSSMAVNATCVTGNCTFPIDNQQTLASWISLDMCHSCMDVSDQIKEITNITTEDVTDVPNTVVNATTTTYISGEVKKFVNLTEYSYFFPPSNLTIRRDLDYDLLPLMTMGCRNYLPNAKMPHPWPVDSWTRSSLVSVQGLALRIEEPTCDDWRQCKTRPLAFDCSLRPCVKTYNASVKNTEYREQELSRQYLHYLPDQYFELAVNRTFHNGTWRDCKGSRTATGTHSVQIALPGVEQPKQSGDEQELSLWYPPECTFNIRQGATLAMAQYIATLFWESNLYSYDHRVTKGDAWLKSLWKSGYTDLATVDQYMEGLATSIGVHIRNNGDIISNDTNEWLSVYGDTLQLQPCIEVRWKYLSYLGILLVAEIVFVIALVLTDNKESISADWKSSLLPLLLQDADIYGQESKHGATNEDEAALYSKARSTAVILCQVNGRWRLSKTTDN